MGENTLLCWGQAKRKGNKLERLVHSKMKAALLGRKYWNVQVGTHDVWGQWVPQLKEKQWWPGSFYMEFNPKEAAENFLIQSGALCLEDSEQVGLETLKPLSSEQRQWPSARGAAGLQHEYPPISDGRMEKFDSMKQGRGKNLNSISNSPKGPLFEPRHPKCPVPRRTTSTPTHWQVAVPHCE